MPPSCLNMNSYRTIKTHFKPNLIFWGAKNGRSWPQTRFLFFLNCRSPHPAILIYLYDHPTGDKEVAGRGGGNNASFQKWRSSLKLFCHQQLRRLSLTISCSDQLLSSYFSLICWDCQSRSAIEIIYEISGRDYLWWSALESICWDPCSRLTLSVEINSWD